MNQLEICYATDCVDQNITSLFLDLNNGVENLIIRVNKLICDCTDLNSIADSCDIQTVNLNGCLYSILDEQYDYWNFSTHLILFSPSKSGNLIVRQYIENKYSESSYLYSNEIDLEKLLNHLEHTKNHSGKTA